MSSEGAFLCPPYLPERIKSRETLCGFAEKSYLCNRYDGNESISWYYA